MNRASSNDEDRRLSDLLKTWQVDAPVPPRFQEQVWRKIDRAERRRAPLTPDWWRQLTEGFAALLRRPAGAAACLAAFLVTGVALGYWSSEQYTQEVEAAWRGAYLHAVTPAPSLAR